MKKIYLLLLISLFTINLFSQEDTAKDKGYRPHFIGITQKFGGYTVFGDIGYTQGMSITTLDFYTQKRNKIGYTPIFSFRFLAPLGSRKYSGNSLVNNLHLEADEHTYNNFGVGFLAGGSHYLVDRRSKETGQGWSLMLNGGFTFDITSFNLFTIYYAGFLIGGELSLKGVYNFSKTIAITFGFDIGFSLTSSPARFDLLSSDQSNSYSDAFNFSNLLVVPMTYGFTMGLLF